MTKYCAADLCTGMPNFNQTIRCNFAPRCTAVAKFCGEIEWGIQLEVHGASIFLTGKHSSHKNEGHSSVPTRLSLFSNSAASHALSFIDFAHKEEVSHGEFSKDTKQNLAHQDVSKWVTQTSHKPNTFKKSKKNIRLIGTRHVVWLTQYVFFWPKKLAVIQTVSIATSMSEPCLHVKHFTFPTSSHIDRRQLCSFPQIDPLRRAPLQQQRSSPVNSIWLVFSKLAKFLRNRALKAQA